MVQLGIIKEDKTMSDNINNTNPPSEPLTREEEYLSAIAGVTSSDDIPEKPLTRVEQYLNKIVEDGGGSVYDKLEAGTNINIEETSDGKAKISATGEVSSEDTYAREQIANHIADKDNPHEVSAADVGLGNCDNTSDLNKPISTATQTALNLKADKTELPEVPITIVKVNNEPLVPASGAVNITVPTQASDVHALADSVKYAGASTAGGSATSAAKLDTASAGSATQPVYFANGIPTATSYSLEKSVPSNAVFTDTTYESKAAASGGTAVSLCTTGEKYTWNSKQNAIDSSHKLSADLVDDTSTTNKFATAAELEQIETNKNNILWANNYGYKNLIKRTKAEIKAANPSISWTGDTSNVLGGLTFTINDDLSITINGTTTAPVIEFTLQTRSEGKTIFKQVGEYRIDGKMQTGYGMFAANRTVGGSGVRYGADEGETAVFTVEQSDLSAPVGIWWGYNGVVGKVFDNITIYPMICLSTMDRTYQPYCPSNYELYQMILAL